MSAAIVRDESVFFPAFHLRKCRSKPAMRKIMGYAMASWLRCNAATRGAAVFDIDDTLVDGHEKVQNGFEHIFDVLRQISLHHPVHIVTARPDDDKESCMRMLQSNGIHVSVDRLHMLPARHYGGDERHIVDFKHNAALAIRKRHGGLAVRVGDKLWDVAHAETSSKHLRHVRDTDCLLFIDPMQGGCLCCKLPGA